MKCLVCNEEILPEDGPPQDAKYHHACLHMFDMLCEALPWCPQSIRERILQHAKRANINLETKR